MAVQGRLLVPDGSKLPPTTVVLNGGEHKTLSRVDGSFTFHAIPAGRPPLPQCAVSFAHS